jgi:hypothetical protein
MTRYGHIGWRVIAVAAFAGTAALAVTLTRAPARDQAALSSAPAGTACAASGLQAWLGPGDGDGGAAAGGPAGGTYYLLEFTNVSASSCDLYGYPGVSAYAAGGQVGRAAAHDMSVRPRRVELAPGATAHSVLRVAAALLRRDACGQVMVPELRVTLPDRGRPAFVPVRFPACSKNGPAFMSVQPIQPRAGGAGNPVPCVSGSVICGENGCHGCQADEHPG